MKNLTNELMADVKAHLSILVSQVMAYIVLMDYLDAIQKIVAIIIAVVSGVWGVYHLRSRVELNKEQKRRLKLRNDALEQEIIAVKKRNGLA